MKQGGETVTKFLKCAFRQASESLHTSFSMSTVYKHGSAVSLSSRDSPFPPLELAEVGKKK